MSAAQIFISYRRDDTAGYARAVYDALARRFSPQRVFIDVDDIAAGQPFDAAITQAVHGSLVLLVLIGPRWLAARNGGPPRLNDPDDFVHQELAAGLTRGMRVIPLLFDGAVMPTEDQLPAPLRPLARRQALAIDAARFSADIDRLLMVLVEALGEPASVADAAAHAAASTALAPGRGRRALVIGGSLALLAAGSAALLLWRGTGTGTGTGTGKGMGTGASSGPLRAAVNGHWQAEVVYDWPNARYAERFEFAGDGEALQGSASFLRLGRGILEGRVGPAGLSFVTRSREQLGNDNAGLETSHRYRGRLVGDELQFVMQTEGGYSAHRPIEFVARRSAP